MRACVLLVLASLLSVAGAAGGQTPSAAERSKPGSSQSSSTWITG